MEEIRQRILYLRDVIGLSFYLMMIHLLRRYRSTSGYAKEGLK